MEVSMQKLFPKFVFVIAIILIAILWVQASLAGQSIDVGEVEQMLADICRRKKIPSLTVAVVNSESTLVAACSGVRKVGGRSDVELSDRHPIGSNTKSMTATLAAVLVEQGKIGWSTTIGEVWGEDSSVSVHSDLLGVTLDDLLSHQGGVRADLNTVGAAWASFFKEENSPREERKRLVNRVLKKKPKFKRGEYHYSNIGFVVAAAMMEARTNQAYEVLMQKEVFGPLGMQSARFRTLASASKLKEPLLWGHQANGDPIDPRIAGAENPSVYASCGTVNLSIGDYAKYARWHLRKKPEPLLKKQATFEHLHRGQVSAPSVGGKYGCGWIRVDTPMGPALSHAGSNTHCFAVIWIFLDKDFAAMACTNTGQQAGYAACDLAVQKMISRFTN